LRCGPCSRSKEQVERILENLFEGLKKLCPDRAVDDAMVTRHRDTHHLVNFNFTVPRHRSFIHRADGEDRRLRRIDHGSELIDTEHSQIADREGRAQILFRFQLPVPRAAR